MLISLNGVSYYVDRGLILDDINFTVNENDRIGIVGRNGSGKSTLLNILAGIADHHSGEREVKKDARVLLVTQDLRVSDSTPLDYLREMDDELQELYGLLASSEAQDFGDINERIYQIESERYETAAPKILSGLGINKTQQERPMTELAGGLRMRIRLASALIQSPDVLILDEPTNHLDLASVLWLTDFLKNYRKPYVIVSHDQTLLNELPTRICHLQNGTLTSYTGNYDSFIEQFKLKQEQSIDINKKIDVKQKQQQQFVDTFKANPKWARIAKTRERLMLKQDEERPPLIPEEPPIAIDFPPCADLKNPIFMIENGAIGYDDKTVLSNVNLSIHNDSRIGILGNNGQGKSTLVKLLAGQLQAKSGILQPSARLKIGYFSQEQADVLDLNLTPYDQLKSKMSDPSDEDIRKHLALFGIDKDKAVTPIANLSGGEKTRLVFAMIASQRPNLIILDEPTNHLDFMAKETLIKAINQFNGAVVIVSHDWDLLAKTTNEYWMVNNGKVMPYKHGLDKYRDLIMRHIQDLNTKGSNTKVSHMSGIAVLSKKNKEESVDVKPVENRGTQQRKMRFG